MKINKIIVSIFTFFFLFSPSLILLAAPRDFKSLINEVIIGNILSPVVPLLIGLAVVLFVYGVIKFMFSSGGEGREEGKDFMFWGIIGIFVMVSVWGLVAILQSTFQLTNSPTDIQIKPNPDLKGFIYN